MAGRTKRPPARLDSSQIKSAFDKGLLSPKPSISSAEFIEAVNRRDEAWQFIFPDFERIETEWNNGRAKTALLAALTAIGKVARVNFILATGIARTEQITRAHVKRHLASKECATQQQLARLKKIELAQEVLSEFSADVAAGKYYGKQRRLHKEIGQIMGQRLSASPIPHETVRDYLKDGRKIAREEPARLARNAKEAVEEWREIKKTADDLHRHKSRRSPRRSPKRAGK